MRGSFTAANWFRSDKHTVTGSRRRQVTAALSCQSRRVLLRTENVGSMPALANHEMQSQPIGLEQWQSPASCSTPF
ncbi:hypothetical protein INR49_018036 [Caranx melampygus]|nr:hypothetical protein INR49_018036 [Caranx melampygus]